MDIRSIRQNYPQYSDLSDEQLAQSLHSKFYSDIPFDEFSSKIGLQSQPKQPIQNATSQEPINKAAGTGQALLQGSTLGFSDEIEALIAATSAAPFVSDRTFRQLFTEARDSLRGEQEQFRKESPKTALAAEFAGGLATGGAGLARSGAVQTARAGKTLASPLLRGAAAGAGIGAVAGAGTADAEDFASVDTLQNALIGAGLGGATGATLPVITRAIGRGIRRLRGKKIDLFDNNGQITDDAIKQLKENGISPDEANEAARRQLEAEGVLTSEQIANFNLFKKRGVDPLRAQVTQRTSDFKELQDAAKSSNEVSETLARQDQRLFEVGEDAVDKIRPVSSNIEETNSSLRGVVDKMAFKLDEEVGTAYQAAKEVAKGQPRVVFNNFAKALSDNRGMEATTGGLISAVRGVLRNKGLIKSGSVFDVNKRGTRLTGDATKKLTVNEAEEIRQFLNSQFEGANPQARKLIRSFKDAIDDDVAGAVGDDIFSSARAIRTEMGRVLGKAKRNKFDQTQGSVLEDVLNNKIPEEKITQRLVSGRDDDLVNMKRFLLEDAGEEGVQAWNNLRAQVLRDALGKAVTQSKGEGGIATFNSFRFKQAFEGLRKTKKFNELFDKQERELIDDIIEIGRLRLPQRNVALGSGPTGEAVKKLVVSKIPFAGDLLTAIQNKSAAKRQINVTRETEQFAR